MLAEQTAHHVGAVMSLQNLEIPKVLNNKL